MNVDMALTYLDFVQARHRVWELRQAGAPAPWAEDPILQRHKFTNVYRVLDHGSQFLLRELLNTAETPADALARAFLYRMTNRPQVWEMTKLEQGFYPTADTVGDTLADYWCDLRDSHGVQVFSGAYIIMPEPGVKGVDKVRSVVKLAERYFGVGPDSVVDRFFEQPSMAGRFKVLHSCAGIGPFIAMQVLTDVGYSPFGHDQDENSFVVPGPGARKGALEIAPDMRPLDVIHWCRDQLVMSDSCPLLPVPPAGPRPWTFRPPSLMDVQNTLCEFSKYARFMRKVLPAKEYRPAHPGTQPAPVLPQHWS